MDKEDKIALIRETINEGISKIEEGIYLLQESVFPYDSLGRLTSVLWAMLPELKDAYKQDYKRGNK